MSMYQHIDLTKMNQLFDGQISFRKQIISEYTELLKSELNKMEQALTRDDYHQIRKCAHKIRPTCSYMGMNRSHNLASNYMTTYDNDETPFADDLLVIAQALRSELGNALEELHNEQTQIEQLMSDSYAAQTATQH